jgi:hypothetical protein
MTSAVTGILYSVYKLVYRFAIGAIYHLLVRLIPNTDSDPNRGALRSLIIFLKYHHEKSSMGNICSCRTQTIQDDDERERGGQSDLIKGDSNSRRHGLAGNKDCKKEHGVEDSASNTVWDKREGRDTDTDTDTSNGTVGGGSNGLQSGSTWQELGLESDPFDGMTIDEMRNDGDLSLAYRTVPELPLSYIFSGNDPNSLKTIKKLDLTECYMNTFTNLIYFECLDTLVLDKNDIGDLRSVPTITSISTLWVNNNQVEDLHRFILDVKDKFPNIEYLSIMNNPSVLSLSLIDDDVDADINGDGDGADDGHGDGDGLDDSDGDSGSGVNCYDHDHDHVSNDINSNDSIGHLNASSNLSPQPHTKPGRINGDYFHDIDGDGMNRKIHINNDENDEGAISSNLIDVCDDSDLNNNDNDYVSVTSIRGKCLDSFSNGDSENDGSKDSNNNGDDKKFKENEKKNNLTNSINNPNINIESTVITPEITGDMIDTDKTNGMDPSNDTMTGSISKDFNDSMKRWYFWYDYIDNDKSIHGENRVSVCSKHTDNNSHDLDANEFHDKDDKKTGVNHNPSGNSSIYPNLGNSLGRHDDVDDSLVMDSFNSPSRKDMLRKIRSESIEAKEVNDKRNKTDTDHAMASNGESSDSSSNNVDNKETVSSSNNCNYNDTEVSNIDVNCTDSRVARVGIIDGTRDKNVDDSLIRSIASFLIPQSLFTQTSSDPNSTLPGTNPHPSSAINSNISANSKRSINIPICPSPHPSDRYQEYRLAIISTLPGLRLLDSESITEQVSVQIRVGVRLILISLLVLACIILVPTLLGAILHSISDRFI